MEDTKTKGSVGELLVAADLLRIGWNISFPYGENTKYDLIIEKEGNIKRIQVKSVFPRKGVLHINCRSSNNWSINKYLSTDFEFIAAVDLESHKIYYIPSNKIRNRLINLRLVQTSNNQKKKINLASDYLQKPL